MAASNDALRRLIPKRSWGDRHGLGVVLWTVMGALGSVAAIGCSTLLLDLLIHRGQVTTLTSPLTEEIIDADPLFQQDWGLYATAGRYGSAIGWQWLPWTVTKFPALANTGNALACLILFALVSLLLTVWSHSQARFHSSASARNQATSLRSALHRQTLRLGPSDITDSRFQTAFQLFTTDSEVVRRALSAWRVGLVRGYVIIPLLVGLALCIDWRLGMLCLIPSGFCWWIFRREQSRRSRERELADSRVETEVQFLAEGLRKTRLVRGYNVEEFEQKNFDQHLARLNEESQLGRNQERWLRATGAMLLLFAGAIVLFLIGLRVVTPLVPIPLASGMTLALIVVVLALEIPRIEQVVSQESVMTLAASRIYRYLDEIPEVGQAVGAKFVEPLANVITFESVGYERGTHKYLNSLDLKIAAGSQVALIALDDQIPRMVAYLLPRFMEPTSGRVLYDGQDIAWGTLESIRAETIYVGGDDPVLNGTVAENLLCGDASFALQDATEAAKLVHAHSFITKLPQGYETVLGEHGEQLPPGEAFRLSLARAVLRKPTVLIVEEPRVIFDDDTKSLIDDAYQRLAQGRTLIFLPARLSTVRRCEQVVLFDGGKVEAIGTHAELRKNSELYRHWDYTRFNTFRHTHGT
ncbi:MAG: ABC transporter ATP-binding protein [Planctomycetaceae bacterium]|nr:ABC transporter ATP-binding protein [Planctomycetaceae bacterium]MCB9952267.1 ABC transporter ATP-binding protein [Planctomycetaceae bacterium]